MTSLRAWFERALLPPPSGLAFAIFRIALGGLVVFDAGQRLPDAALFLSENGLFPSVLQESCRPSLINLFPGDVWPVAVVALYGLAGVALVVGAFSRAAAFVAWLLVLSIHARNPFVTNGGDFLLRLSLLWGCFLPLGSSLSFDRFRNCRDASEIPVAAWTVFRIQVALVYFVTAGHKLAEPMWRNGEALRRSFGHVEWQKPAAEALSHFVSHIPGAGWMVIGAQFLAAIALLAKPAAFRWAGILVIATMQTAMFACFHLGLFPWISLAVLIPLLPLFDGEKPVLTMRRDWRTGACVIVAIATFSYAILSLIRSSSNGVYDRTLRFAGLDQLWPMFAAPPEDSTRVAVVKRIDGRRLDLLAQMWFGNGVITSDPLAFPDSSHRLYVDARWTAFLGALGDGRFPGGRRSQRLVARRLSDWAASPDPNAEDEVRSIIVYRGTPGGAFAARIIASSRQPSRDGDERKRHQKPDE